MQTYSDISEMLLKFAKFSILRLTFYGNFHPCVRLDKKKVSPT